MRIEQPDSAQTPRDNQQNSAIKCPRCGMETEQGIFTCGRDIASSAFWTSQNELHNLFPRSEKVVEKPVGVIHFYGYRCPTCRVLVLDY